MENEISKRAPEGFFNAATVIVSWYVVARLCALLPRAILIIRVFLLILTLYFLFIPHLFFSFRDLYKPHTPAITNGILKSCPMLSVIEASKGT